MKLKWLFSLGFLLALGACRLEINTGTDVFGSGGFSSESRTISSFNQVQLNGVGDAQITKGYYGSLVIEADRNILPCLKAEVNNHVLVISVQDGVNIHPVHTIRYTIVTPDLNAVTLNGSGNASVSDPDVNNFTISLNGSGNVTADGISSYLSCVISGAGNIDASDLKSKTVYATIRGTGNITAWSTDYLNAVISGCGNIDYWGNPYLDTSITGIGSVNWLGY